MRLCPCGATIPTTKVIDGKRRILKNRTKCLACVPFKFRPSTSDAEKSRKNRAKQQRYYAKVREHLGTDPLSFRGGQRKAYLVSLLGGSCVLCGYARVERNLSFHHVLGKDFPLTVRAFRAPLDTILAEIVKCVVLCCNCHGEVHEGLHDPALIAAKQAEAAFLVSHLKGRTWEEMGLPWSVAGVIQRDPQGFTTD